MLDSAYQELLSFDTTVANRIVYHDVIGGGSVEANSVAFSQLLLPMGTECLRAVQASSTQPRVQSLLAGNEACQAMANLCVLQLYDTSSVACELFSYLQSASAATVNGQDQWRERLPWLYYDVGSNAENIEDDVALTLSLEGEGSKLRYELATYSLNGTYLGLQTLQAQLQLCRAENAGAYLSVGTDLEVGCKLELSSLLGVTEPTFFDMYLRVDGASSRSDLYPVPVRITNLRSGGVAVNTDGSSGNDRLVRRFFVSDAASGIESGDAQPVAVRYLRHAHLLVTLQDGEPTRMLPPRLELEYVAARAPPGKVLSAETGAEVESEFVAQYTQSLDSTMNSMQIFFFLAITALALGWVYLSWTHMRRNRTQGVDTPFLLAALANLCRVFANVFWWLAFGVAAWFYLAFKHQDDIYVMMPLKDELDLFYTGILLLWFAKAVHVAEILYTQTRHDVLFLDWEQPITDGNAEGGDAEKGAEGAATPGVKPVSAWRSIFVANEWVRLQTSRKVFAELSLFSLLFLLEGVGYIEHARLCPEGECERGVPYHVLLRFALSSLLFMLVGFVQGLFRFLIWDRFLEDRVWQFVDLLALSNLSCLLLETPHFGYYLHGRSVHSHADTGMLELNEQLKREEEGLCTKRGLQPDSDVQTFEIYISRSVRELVGSALQGGMAARAQQHQYRRPPPRRGTQHASQHQPLAPAQRRGFRSTPEALLLKYREVQAHLMTFVSGQHERHKLEVRPKLYWEKLAGLPPHEMANASVTASLFLEDPAGRFKTLLLAGREYDLLLLQVLTYTLFDIHFGNSFAAAFAAYVLELLVRFARHYLAVKNISHKTFVDERFLL